MIDMDKAIEEAKAAVLPFESWERLKGESSLAFAAFCVYRDYGPERNVRKAVDIAKQVGVAKQVGAEKDEAVRASYGVWKNWCAQYRWKERAADFDRYIEKLKIGEMRKTIEAQGEKHREVTGKILDTVSKKLDSFDPAELTQDNVIVWAEKAIKAEREASNQRFEALVLGNEKPATKQGELLFGPDFDGL